MGAPPTQLEPTPEQLAFCDDEGRAVWVSGLPRAGKTTALAMRARKLGGPVIWAGSWQEAAWLPEGSRVSTLPRLVSELYMRRHKGLASDGLRQIDREELRRVFGHVNAGALPGDMNLWFEAYLAAKRVRGGNEQVALSGILHRQRLSVRGQDTVQMLVSAMERTLEHLSEAGMIWPLDLLPACTKALSKDPNVLAQLMAGARMLCVDDVQLLSRLEVELVCALARAGATISLTFGSMQCINGQDGAAGLSAQAKLQAAGLSQHVLTDAVGLTTQQVSSIGHVLNLDAARKVRALRKSPFRLELEMHENMSKLLDRLSRVIEDRPLSEGSGSATAIVTPLASLSRLICNELLARQLSVIEVGRSAGENSAGFLVCVGLARAISDPLDVLAHRQIGYLFADAETNFESVLMRCVEEGCSLEDAALGSASEEVVREMFEWLNRVREFGPFCITTAIREAPLWPADPPNEAGLDRFDQVLKQLNIQHWEDPQWMTMAALSADSSDDRIVLDSHVPILCLEDTRGRVWSDVHVVGFSEGLIPGPLPVNERNLMGHPMAHILSRGLNSVTLHHCKEMTLAQGGQELEFEPSHMAYQLGLAEAPKQGPQNHPRFTQSFRPR